MSGVMRISVRSLRPWRIASCAAACGMRWVKPSKATVSPSKRFSATAACNDWNLAMSVSDVEEDGFVVALQADVEGVGGQAAFLAAGGNQRLQAYLVLDT